MKHFAILRFAKLKTLHNVASSGQHTWRERPTPNADEAKTSRNRTVGAKSSVDLVAAVDARVTRATEKTAESVPCIEVLATASPEWWKLASRQQLAEFFERAAKWIQSKFGEDNVVSMTAHFDETSPHLVAYVVPLVDIQSKTRKRSVIVGTNPDGTKKRETREFQTTAGCRLSASYWLDGREKLSQMQTEFAAEMRPLGLRRGLEKSRAKHQTIKAYYARLNAPQRTLPEVATPMPKPMPPKPPEPSLLASKKTREQWKEWHQEATKRERQRRQHLAEKATQGAAAVELIQELAPKARERDQAVAIRGRLEAEVDGMRSRARAFERRAINAEAVAQLFTPEEIEQRRLQRQLAAEATRQTEHAAAQQRCEQQFFKQQRTTERLACEAASKSQPKDRGYGGPDGP